MSVCTSQGADVQNFEPSFSLFWIDHKSPNSFSYFFLKNRKFFLTVSLCSIPLNMSPSKRLRSRTPASPYHLNLYLKWYTAGLSLRGGRGPGISSSYYEHCPQLLSKENIRKIEPKEIPSCLIPCLLVVLVVEYPSIDLIFRYCYNQLQKYLRHGTVFWLKWPVHDLVLETPLHPLSKLLAIQDHAQNLEEQLWMGGRREVSILSHRPVTSSDLKQERLFFRESVPTFLQLVSLSVYTPGFSRVCLRRKIMRSRVVILCKKWSYCVNVLHN